MELRRPIKMAAPSAVRPGRAYEYAHVGHPLYPAAALMLTERQENISNMTLIYKSQVTYVSASGERGYSAALHMSDASCIGYGAGLER